MSPKIRDRLPWVTENFAGLRNTGESRKSRLPSLKKPFSGSEIGHTSQVFTLIFQVYICSSYSLTSGKMFVSGQLPAMPVMCSNLPSYSRMQTELRGFKNFPQYKTREL